MLGVVLSLAQASRASPAQDMIWPPGPPATLELTAADAALAELCPELVDDELADRPARALAIDIDFDGQLYIWARANALDPVLVVEKEAAVLFGRDDNSGGGTTALLVVEAVAGAKLRAIVTSTGAASLGRLELCVRRARESEDTRALAASVNDLRAAVQEAQADGDRARAREVFALFLDEVTALPGRAESLALTRALWTLDALGDALGEPALPVRLWSLAEEHCALFLPPEDRMLQTARQNLGFALFNAGDSSAARPRFEAVLEVRERLLEPAALDLAMARVNLAVVLLEQGASRRARSLLELALPPFQRSFSSEASQLQLVRIDLAAACANLGDLERALELQEDALAALAGRPAEDAALQLVRSNLAGTLRELGQFTRARALQEQVLEIDRRRLSPSDPNLWRSHGDLAATLLQLGDLTRARELEEQVLAGFEHILPADSLDLATARHNLAATLVELGDLKGGTALEERVLTQRRAQLGEAHPLTQASLHNLAEVAFLTGDSGRAREIFEAEVTVLLGNLPPEHASVLTARRRLASVRVAQGEYSAARAELEEIVAHYARTRTAIDEELIEARGELAWALAGTGQREACRAATLEFIAGLRTAVRMILLGHASREVEERVVKLSAAVSLALSLSSGAGRFEPDPALERAAFALVEGVRSAGLLTTRLGNTVANDPALVELRLDAREKCAELARLASQPDTSREELSAAREDLEATERRVADRVGQDPLAAQLLSSIEHATLPELHPESVLTSFWHYTRRAFAGSGSNEVTAEPALIAYVVRPGQEPVRIELGAPAEIEAAVAHWRADIDEVGAGERRGIAGTTPTLGNETPTELRAVLLDPLRPHWQHAQHLVLVPDGALHLVPFDALELEPGVWLGERFTIELRPSVYDLARPKLVAAPADTVLVLGGIDYDGAPLAPTSARAVGREVASATRSSSGRRGPSSGAEPEFVRAGAFSAGFTALPATLEEARAIVELARATGKAGAELHSGREASRETLFELAGRARWLHLATHGWFAPESIAPDPPEPHGSPLHAARTWSRAALVRGTAPKLLCGLALAGANREHDALGRLTGVVTAQELAHLDLRGCELAVLSACETSIGVRRAGQGVASLQQALLMAGARSVITSLWQVPDRSTQELMTRFYRHLWAEHLPKERALWLAKRELRDARDERGAPLHALRDWAGWVLMGDPR